MSSPRRVQVYFEDSAGPSGPKEFGPHKLLCACVEDAMGLEPHTIKSRLDGLAMNGVSKLLGVLRRDLRRLIDGSGAVLVVVDGDKIREELVRLGWSNRDRASRLSDDAVEGIIVAEAARAAGLDSAPTTLSVCALQFNTETLVAAAAKAAQCDAVLRGRAMNKELAARDAVLARAAFHGDSDVRRRIQIEVPSFLRIVERCVALLRS